MRYIVCGGYSQPNTSKYSMKTHHLKNRHNRRKQKEICSGYSQPNTSNNSMKTYCLKHTQDMRREKRYVVEKR